MMNRYLVVYDTTTGGILRASPRPNTFTTVVSGNGTLDGDSLVGTSFSGVATGDMVVMRTSSREVRCGVAEVVSGTELRLGRVFPDQDAGGVSFTVKRVGDPVSATNEEKATAINEVKVEVGHQNVDALKVKTRQSISASSYYVDLGDGNKVKKVEEVAYE